MIEEKIPIKIAAAIMAGGKSSRMAGRHKGLLRTPRGETFTERILIEMRSLTDLVYISYGDTIQMEGLPVEIVQDIFFNCGPLGGLHAVLTKAEKNGVAAVAVAACDMPFVEADLYRFLFQKLKSRTGTETESASGSSGEGLFRKYDGVVTVMRGKIHPMAAIYSVQAVSIFRGQLENKKLRLKDALEKLKILYVELEGTPYERMLININTEEEYAEYLQR